MIPTSTPPKICPCRLAPIATTGPAADAGQCPVCYDAIKYMVSCRGGHIKDPMRHTHEAEAAGADSRFITTNDLQGGQP